MIFKCLGISLHLQLKNTDISNHYWRFCNVKPLNTDGHSSFLSFIYANRPYSFSSFADVEALFLWLGFIAQDGSPLESLAPAGPNHHGDSVRPLSPLWHQAPSGRPGSSRPPRSLCLTLVNNVLLPDYTFLDAGNFDILMTPYWITPFEVLWDFLHFYFSSYIHWFYMIYFHAPF